MSTIYALSSGACPSGVAVMRVSGPGCRVVLETMVGAFPRPRLATLRSIRKRTGEEIDRGVVLWFPGPGSFTGEDTIEFQVHGSRAVVRALAAALGSFDGVRPAEAGEFTRRAFLSGRIDLTEAEGLADLLAAETEAQRRQALAQSEGSLRRLYEGWRSDLIEARALIEADLDFADEEDVPGSVIDRAFEKLEALSAGIVAHLAEGRRGEVLRDGLQVVILGPPNAGKSSLLNALARRDVAIVTAEAGTTRDLVEVHLDLDGHPVTLVDTAGLRETAGEVEREGIRRALERGERADLILWMQAPDVPASSAPEGVDCPIWRVDGKGDSVGDRRSREPVAASETRRFSISTHTGLGLDGLVAALSEEAGKRTGSGSAVVPTRDRHRVLLTRTVEDLSDAIRHRNEPELAADRLRNACDDLGRITGRIDVEDLLDHIFGSFCIGK
ncbi:MAG: tRNA uridine-5-carboxymethylaminomethyl(34) synthesis GTPase MnmE [Phyllobacteriaceae bacterium]|nr:tRNA uridine-5-carboxymethylaminomethyl(34) synthesis GTPase MnmE [Phyllobacteriaceae bacterium]